MYYTYIKKKMKLSRATLASMIYLILFMMLYTSKSEIFTKEYNEEDTIALFITIFLFVFLLYYIVSKIEKL